MEGAAPSRARMTGKPDVNCCNQALSLKIPLPDGTLCDFDSTSHCLQSHLLRHRRPSEMGRKKAKANYRRIVLRLPDLDHSKMAVLNSLTSPASPCVQIRHRKIVAWYCSEPRIAF